MSSIRWSFLSSSLIIPRDVALYPSVSGLLVTRGGGTHRNFFRS